MASFIEVTRVWKKVFTQKKYFLVLVIVAAVFYFLNGLILFLPNIKTFYSQIGLLSSLRLIALASLDYSDNISFLSFGGIILLSLIIGVFISLLVYRFDVVSSIGTQTSILGAVGIFLGAAAQGCAGCGVGVLSILGFSSVLTLLPFHGQELLSIAILLTGFSVYNISGKLNNPTCPVKLNTHLKGGKKK